MLIIIKFALKINKGFNKLVRKKIPTVSRDADRHGHGHGPYVAFRISHIVVQGWSEETKGERACPIKRNFALN
jgi:hypothetical protein